MNIFAGNYTLSIACKELLGQGTDSTIQMNPLEPNLNHKTLADNCLPSAPFASSWASLSDNILSQSEWLSESIWLLIWFVNNIYYHHCSILLNTIVSTTSLSCVSVSPVQSYLSLLPYLISILNPSPMSTGPGWRKKQSFIRWTNWTLNPSSPAGNKTTLDQSIIMIFLMFNIQRKLHMQASRELFIQKYFSVATTL